MITNIVVNTNRSPNIKETLLSIQEQNYSNQRIVFIDNASNDDSWNNICNILGKTNNFEIQGNIDNIDIVGMHNEFPSSNEECLVQGISKFIKDTDFFGYMESGDQYLPGKLSKSISIMENSAELCGVCYSDYINNIDGYPINFYVPSFNRSFLFSACFIPPCPIISKIAIEKTGIPDVNLLDFALYDFWIKMTENFIALHIPEILHFNFSNHKNNNLTYENMENAKKNRK
jgi:glycosyltransferase involved in cell wall biosynthesis